MRPAVMANV
ncbi:unnamed protein product [Linum tenue]|uniref:Uncharacterized protein n=1 Tax=Linum tenue TaxID=586396 RepID=A0AAV0H448_9ROSI|nr:unnamed protein product [Linum tenue]